MTWLFTAIAISPENAVFVLIQPFNVVLFGADASVGSGCEIHIYRLHGFVVVQMVGNLFTTLPGSNSRYSRAKKSRHLYIYGAVYQINIAVFTCAESLQTCCFP